VTRRALLLAAGAVALIAAATLAVSSRSPDALVRKQASALARLLRLAPGESADSRKARLERELPALLENDARVQLSDVTAPPRDRQALIRLAAETGGARSIDLALDDVVISVDAAESAATMRARATLLVEGPTLALRDVRNVTLNWVRRDGVWRVASAEIAPRTHEEPEARP
jgi:hypothetical protein